MTMFSYYSVAWRQGPACGLTIQTASPAVRWRQRPYPPARAQTGFGCGHRPALGKRATMRLDKMMNHACFPVSALLVLLFFHPVLFSANTFFLRDIHRWFYPAKQLSGSIAAERIHPLLVPKLFLRLSIPQRPSVRCLLPSLPGLRRSCLFPGPSICTSAFISFWDFFSFMVF